MKKTFVIILTLLSIGMLSVGCLWYTGVWQIGGVRSVVYTLGVNVKYAPTYNNYHLYLAKYSFAEPKINNGKGSYTIWQYTDRGRINGIKHNVDLCKFNPKYTVEYLRLK